MKGQKNFESDGSGTDSMKDLKNFKPINPDGVKGTILSGCDIPGQDAICGCSVYDDPGHHCAEGFYMD